MLSREQATVVADQMIADAQRQSRDSQLTRLISAVGPKPPSLTVEEFAAYIRDAELQLRWNWLLWSAIAGFSAGALTLAYWHLPQILIGWVPAGFLEFLQLRRKLVAMRVRRLVGANA